MIVVCSLARLQETVVKSRARHVVTLVRDEELIRREREALRSNGVKSEDHLWLEMDDIAEEMDGMIAPSEQHVERLLTFLKRWDRTQPMVVHCYAGISRSTRSRRGSARPRPPPIRTGGSWRLPTAISSAGEK